MRVVLDELPESQSRLLDLPLQPDPFVDRVQRLHDPRDPAIFLLQRNHGDIEVLLDTRHPHVVGDPDQLNTPSRLKHLPGGAAPVCRTGGRQAPAEHVVAELAASLGRAQTGEAGEARVDGLDLHLVVEYHDDIGDAVEDSLGLLLSLLQLLLHPGSGPRRSGPGSWSMKRTP